MHAKSGSQCKYFRFGRIGALAATSHFTLPVPQIDSVKTAKDFAGMMRIVTPAWEPGRELGNRKWVRVMRCHLMKDGRVRGVLLLDDVPREQLIEQAEAILREWTPSVTSVEVLSGTSVIYRSSDSGPSLEMAAD